MKKVFLIPVCFFLACTTIVPLTSCEKPKTDTLVKLTELTSDGVQNTTTTQNIIFTLEYEIPELNKDDIALMINGGVLVNKIQLTHVGTRYTLQISPSGTGWEEGDRIYITSITKKGYLISLPTDKFCVLHAHVEQVVGVNVLDFQTNGTQNTVDTTSLIFTLSQEIPGLSASDFNFLSDASFNPFTSISNEGPVYTLPISGAWNEGNYIRINSITKQGYSITIQTPFTQKTLHKNISPTIVTLSNFSSDGDAHTETTSNLFFTLSQEIPGLSENDILLTTSSGVSINKGTLTHVETSYTLPISGTWNEGDTVIINSITKEHYSINFQDITEQTLHKQDIAITMTNFTTVGTSITSALNFTLSQQILGLSESDISLEASGGVEINKEPLTNDGANYTLPISGEWNQGDTISININKLGYIIDIAGISAQTLNWTNTEITVSNFHANGAAGSLSTTSVEFTLSQEIPGLVTDDIVLTPTSGNVIEGQLTHDGTSYTLPISGDWSEGEQITLAISKRHYSISFSGGTNTSTLHKGPDINIVASGLNISYSSTTDIKFTLSQEVPGLSSNDINIVTQNLTSIIKGTLSHVGTSYTLPISGLWDNDNEANIVIAKSNFHFDLSSFHPVSLLIFSEPSVIYGNGDNSIEFTPYRRANPSYNSSSIRLNFPQIHYNKFSIIPHVYGDLIIAADWYSTEECKFKIESYYEGIISSADNLGGTSVLIFTDYSGVSNGTFLNTLTSIPFDFLFSYNSVPCEFKQVVFTIRPGTYYSYGS